MLPKRKLKQARMILISAISFTIGGYLLWVAFSVFWTFSVEKGFNHSHIDHVNFKLIKPFPSYFRDEDLKIFVFSLIGGIGGIANGVWYVINIHKPDAFD